MANRIDAPEAYDKITNPTATTGDMRAADPAGNGRIGRIGRALIVHSQTADIVLTKRNGATVTYTSGELSVGLWHPFVFTRVVSTGAVVTVAWE